MGYIKLFRKIQEWGWYDDPNTLALWVHLLLDANWKEQLEWHGVNIERGSMITSVAKISTSTGLSERQVRTCLGHLTKTGEIKIEATNKWTKITICKYDSYQSCTDDGCQADDNQPTSNRQATDEQPTTIEESNNAIREEEKKEIDIQGGEDPGDKPKKKIKVFVKPTLKEIADYCDEEHIPVDPSYFYDYYESNGWLIGKAPMKDWKATIRNWGRRRADQGQQGLFQEHDDATEEEKANWLNGRRPQKV